MLRRRTIVTLGARTESVERAMTEAQTMPLPDDRILPEQEMLRRAREFRELAARRRTVRAFDSRPVARELIAECIAAAGTAPSGANQQPWHFVAISDPTVKQRIRLAAEQEERAFYERRATEEWLEALRPLGTDWRKPFLESAPWLIAIFVQKWGRRRGRRVEPSTPRSRSASPPAS